MDDSVRAWVDVVEVAEGFGIPSEERMVFCADLMKATEDTHRVGAEWRRSQPYLYLKPIAEQAALLRDSLLGIKAIEDRFETIEKLVASSMRESLCSARAKRARSELDRDDLPDEERGEHWRVGRGDWARLKRIEKLVAAESAVETGLSKANADGLYSQVFLDALDALAKQGKALSEPQHPQPPRKPGRPGPQKKPLPGQPGASAPEEFVAVIYRLVARHNGELPTYGWDSYEEKPAGTLHRALETLRPHLPDGFLDRLTPKVLRNLHASLKTAYAQDGQEKPEPGH
jgi:hypothetical protein